MLLLVVVCFMCIVIAVTGANGPEGKWTSTFGEIEITEKNGVYSGKYTYDNGIIQKAKLSGNVLSGEWVETPKNEPKRSGKFKWTFNKDFSSFTGTWGYGNSNSDGGAWTGQGTSKSIPDCNDLSCMSKCEQKNPGVPHERQNYYCNNMNQCVCDILPDTTGLWDNFDEETRQFCDEICYAKDGSFNKFQAKNFKSGSECMQECMDSERCVCGDGFKVPCPESCPFIGYESWENFCAPGCCIGKYGGPTVDRNDASCNDPSEKGVRCCEWTKEWNSKYYPRKY